MRCCWLLAVAGTASAFARCAGFGETAFEGLACLAEAHAPAEARVSEGWLGGRDSNPDNLLQRQMSYRWTTSQCLVRPPWRD